MSEEVFSSLLARLNSDPLRAGEEYERIRARLIYFFERKGCTIPAELCDETLNRIGRKIADGYEIDDLFKFGYGVARLVLLEHWADPKRQWDQLDEQLSLPPQDMAPDEHRLECMKKCVKELSPADRDLIVKNCTLDKIGREHLAKTRGLTKNALRLRVFRIRSKLDECRAKCLEAAAEK